MSALSLVCRDIPAEEAEEWLQRTLWDSDLERGDLVLVKVSA